MRRRLPSMSPRAAFRRARRSPLAHWAVALALGAAILATLQGRAEQLSRLEQRYGHSTSVLVLARARHAGELITGADLRTTVVPRSVVPDGALRSFHRPTRLSAEVAAGEILVRQRLSPTAPSALSAELPDGAVAVSFALPRAHVDLHRGDRVDVVGPGPDGYSEPLARNVLVLAARGDSATVAIDRDDASEVTDAAMAATINVWLRPPEG